MSDEEYEEEVEEEEEAAEEPVTPAAAKEDDKPDFVKRKEKQHSELDEQLQGYINEWRKQKNREEEELKALKERQIKRRALRGQQEQQLAAKKKREEQERQKAIEDVKKKEAEEKRKKVEEAEKLRQLILKGEQEKRRKLDDDRKKRAQEEQLKRLREAESRKALGGPKGYGSGAAPGQEGAAEALTKTKEQLAEEKAICLSIRIKPLNIDDLGKDALKRKADELWNKMVTLETERYDLEERQRRQDYDLKELKERQKMQLRQKALKLGLNPEALTGKYPPKIRLASKFERRVDTRSYEERKSLFEGGYGKLMEESNMRNWQERMDEFKKRPGKALPKWFGERPGRKKGDPATPDAEVQEEQEEPTYEPPPPEEDEAVEAEAEAEEEEVEEEEEEEEEEE